jgi:hypothetical protein
MELSHRSAGPSFSFELARRAAMIGLVILTVAACGADNVVFKCTQTCPTGTTSLPNACDSSDKSAEDAARILTQAAPDSGGLCTYACEKTEEACTQK